jgi:hypothetical protein
LLAVFVAVAANQLQNEKTISPNETNDVINETDVSSSDSIILEKVFNETFKLTMIIPKDAYALGEPVNITLRLTNLSNESVTISYPWMSLLGYFVIDQSGHLIYGKTEVPGEIALTVIEDKTMEPNMAHEKLFVWSQVYTEKYYLPDGSYRFVECPITAPGAYTIVGRTYFYHGADVYEAKLQINIQII